MFATIGQLENIIFENERRLDELQETTYTEEQVNHIVDALLKEIVKIKYTNDALDVSYDEVTQTFTLTEYNQYGEVFDVDILTIDEIIDIILNGYPK